MFSQSTTQPPPWSQRRGLQPDSQQNAWSPVPDPSPSPRNGRGPSQFSGPAVCRTQPVAQDLLLPASRSPPPPTSPCSSPPSIPAPRPEPHLSSPSSPDLPGPIPSRVTALSPPLAGPCPPSPAPQPSPSGPPPGGPAVTALLRPLVVPCSPLPCRSACCTKTLLTSTAATGFGWVEGAVALFRGDSFLQVVEPFICKLVPQTTLTEDGKAIVVPSIPGAVLGPGCWKRQWERVWRPPGEEKPDQSQQMAQGTHGGKARGPRVTGPRKDNLAKGRITRLLPPGPLRAPSALPQRAAKAFPSVPGPSTALPPTLAQGHCCLGRSAPCPVFPTPLPSPSLGLPFSPIRICLPAASLKL